MLFLINEIVPRFTDLIYRAIYPFGTNLLLGNVLLVCVSILLYILSIWNYRHYLIDDERTCKHLIFELLIIIITGTLIPFLSVFYFVILLIKSGFYEIDIISAYKSDNDRFKPRTTMNSFKLVIGGFFAFLFLLIAFTTPIWGYFVSLELNYIPLYMILGGSLAGIIFALVMKPNKLPLYHKRLNFTKKFRKIIITLSIIVCFSFSLVVINSGFLKLHSEPPEYLTTAEINDYRIITYNIRTGTATENNPLDNWDNRKDEFSTYLNSFDADIIGLQEAYLFQIEDIFGYLDTRNYEFTGFARNDGVHLGEHCAILYDSDKFTFMDGDTFWLSDFPNFPSRTWGNSHFRVCTWVRLKEISSGKQFCVFNTHYDFSDEFKAEASKLINQKVCEYSGNLPTILMGDFNMRNHSVSFQYLEEYGDKPLSDSYRDYHGGIVPYDYTTSKFDANYDPTPEPGRSRIDYIFTSEAIDVLDCEIPKDSYGINQTYSDHYPVVLDCRF